jgi:hypothetical protein
MKQNGKSGPNIRKQYGLFSGGKLLSEPIDGE